MPKPDFSELLSRINVDMNHFSGLLPERNAIAWRGYLTALYEWQLLSRDNFSDLMTLLPLVEDDPVGAIMLGRGNYYLEDDADNS